MRGLVLGLLFASLPAGAADDADFFVEIDYGVSDVPGYEVSGVRSSIGFGFGGCFGGLRGATIRNAGIGGCGCGVVALALATEGLAGHGPDVQQMARRLHDGFP